ncbi:GAF domain-containing protein [Mycolicibacterium sp. P1-18]|nr:GAF domain-containing protein [Mycolicibacterium sp. P1-18]
MTGFDDWLNRLLEECARNAGEDVTTYVARAVASRMVSEQKSADGPGLIELMTHLTSSGTFAVSTMPDASMTVNDPSRLRALYATGLLDTPPEEAFDRITRAAAAALDAPHSAMSLVDVDRQFFKSKVGLGGNSPEERQTSLDRSVCQYALAKGTPLMIEDARVHPVFKNHPAVVDGTVVAYLGIPLVDDEENAIGTLCVFDPKPRLWTTGHVQILGDFASLAAERAFGPGGKSTH